MNSYVCSLQSPEDLLKEFKKIGVDPGGMTIMQTKGILRLIKLSQIASYGANILKQEMLSLGGDVALCRGALTGKTRATDCLVIGSVAQLLRLTEKLKKQPFGLAQVGADIKRLVHSVERKDAVLFVGSKRIRLGHRTLVAGIINMTGDSFSRDGMLGMDVEEALDVALRLVQDGADILDIGGESTRPGAQKVGSKEECRRVIPLLSRLTKKVRVPVSIDTTKSEVARAALDAGASIVNDISALRFDKKMAGLIARTKASVVLMHMQGTPQTMQRHPEYADVVADVIIFLREAIQRARDAGIPDERIIVDPGIGLSFGKTLEHNCEILKNLFSFRSLGRPVLVGFSRKSFIGTLLGVDVGERQWGTAGAAGIAVANGADMVRVHDVKEMKQVLKVADALARSSSA